MQYNTILPQGNLDKEKRPNGAKKARILFVDDEVSVVLSLKRALRDEFEIEAALSAEQALKILEDTGPVAAVVSDMRMPDVDGATFLAEIKQHAPTATRIMLTGDQTPEAIIDAINKGHVFRFLQKPCPLPSMRDVLREAVEEHKRLTEHERISNNLLASFQHEFRTPIHHIIGFASFLLEDDLQPGAIKDYARYIINSGSALVDMTDTLLMLSSLREEHLSAHVDVVSTRELFNDAAGSLEQELSERKIDLKISIDDDVEELRVDPRLIRQAIKALLSNAIKFSEPEQLVYIHAGLNERLGRQPVISVIDGGKGIEPEKLEQMMQPFMQDDMGAARRFDGIGLGLPLVKEVAKIHGGEFKILSAAGSGVHASLRLTQDALVMPALSEAGKPEATG